MASGGATVLMCVGDMHLGRLASGLPAGILDEYRLAPRHLGPAEAWRRVVAQAIDLAVDAVVLAGDLVESDNARFEAFGQLQSGIGRLTAAGIDVCAVAGNHDVEVLPRLADSLEGFRVLGTGGQWEDHIVSGRDGPDVRLVGWSFPQKIVTASPLPSGRLPFPDDMPLLGILHADLDASGSRYAPVGRAELTAAGPDIWLLGHIHRPTLSHGDGRFGYLGSLVGLDRTETGRHGPWLISVDGGGQITQRQLALGPLRWETVVLPVDELANPVLDLQAAVIAALRRRRDELADELTETQALGCRVRLTGRCGDFAGLLRAVAEFRTDQLAVPCDPTLLFVDRLVNDAAPAIDLTDLARTADPPGLLARHLLAIERGDDQPLVDTACTEAAEVTGRPQFVALNRRDPGDLEIRPRLLRVGYRALAALLAQQEDEHAVV